MTVTFDEEGSGTVVCINCQGSGLSVPDDFLQVLGDEEVGFTEEDYVYAALLPQNCFFLAHIHIALLTVAASS